MTPDRMLRWLLSFPFPGALAAMQGGDLVITLEGEVLRFDGAWRASDGQRIPCTLDDAPSADDIHAEIRRGLDIARGITGASWRRGEPDPSPALAEIKADCVGPDLPADDPYIPTLAEIADEPPLEEALHDRLTDEMDRRRDAEQALAKMTDAHAVVSQRLIGSQKEVAERDATIESNEAKVIDLTLRLGETQNRVADLESELAGVRAAKRSVEGDCAISAKRAAEAERARKADADLLVMRTNDLAAERARAEAAEAKVKRLLRQRNAAHAVLDEAGFAMPQEGKRRRPLAVRVSLAHAQVWDSYDCINAIDEIAKVVGLISPCRSDGVTESEVIARVKALRNDDDTRTAIAVAVGLDGSASLGMILDTVKDRSPDLLRLVNYHQAPIRFNDRPLTLAERASFVIRRLWQGRTNAAAEAAALRRELGDIADALGDLPDTAERERIGDREDHLGLSTAERIRLSR